ncbi:hypothetical protein BH10ACI1_BH10ACI1_19260 [soil metagenome]
MKFFRVLSILALLFAVSSLALAQDTGSLKGKVRTTKGDGIAGVTIIARQNGEDVKSATSDSKGNFVINGLKPGNYNLAFTKNGYSSGVLYNIEVKKKSETDLGDRLILSADQGTLVLIKGSVFNQDGVSIYGAKIVVEKVNGDGSVKKVGSGYSSESGEFTFRFAEGTAKYRVTASAKGVSASKEIEVDSAAIYRLAITLKIEK